MTFFGKHSIYGTTKEILTSIDATSFAKQPFNGMTTISSVFFKVTLFIIETTLQTFNF